MRAFFCAHSLISVFDFNQAREGMQKTHQLKRQYSGWFKVFPDKKNS